VRASVRILEFSALVRAAVNPRLRQAASGGIIGAKVKYQYPFMP